MTSWEQNWPEEDRKEAAKIWAEIREAEKKAKWFVALLLGGLFLAVPVPPLGLGLLAGSYFWHEHYQGKIVLLHRLYKQLLDKNRTTSQNPGAQK